MVFICCNAMALKASTEINRDDRCRIGGGDDDVRGSTWEWDRVKSAAYIDYWMDCAVVRPCHISLVPKVTTTTREMHLSTPSFYIFIISRISRRGARMRGTSALNSWFLTGSTGPERVTLGSALHPTEPGCVRPSPVRERRFAELTTDGKGTKAKR